MGLHSLHNLSNGAASPFASARRDRAFRARGLVPPHPAPAVRTRDRPRRRWMAYSAALFLVLASLSANSCRRKRLPDALARPPVRRNPSLSRALLAWFARKIRCGAPEPSSRGALQEESRCVGGPSGARENGRADASTWHGSIHSFGGEVIPSTAHGLFLLCVENVCF
jgi:hypothetical protein